MRCCLILIALVVMVVMALMASTAHATGCSGVVSVTTSGFNLTDGIDPNYDDDMDCTWNINPPNGKLVQLEFLALSLESESDFVVVKYNGYEKGRYTGLYKPNVWTSEGSGTTTVHFFSDSSTALAGFFIQVTFVSACPVGQEDNGQGTCVYCSAGSYRDTASNNTGRCETCVAGTYNSAQGQTSCNNCPYANIKAYGDSPARHSESTSCKYQKVFFALDQTASYSWAEAKLRCELDGANLATIRDSDDSYAALNAILYPLFYFVSGGGTFAKPPVTTTTTSAPSTSTGSTSSGSTAAPTTTSDTTTSDTTTTDATTTDNSGAEYWFGLEYSEQGVLTWANNEAFNTFAQFEATVDEGKGTVYISSSQLAWYTYPDNDINKLPALCSRIQCSDQNSYIDANGDCVVATVCDVQNGDTEVSPLKWNADRVCSCSPTTHYRNDGICTPLTDCDLVHEYISVQPTLTSDRECEPIVTCDTRFFYESQPPTITSNRVCSSLTTCSK